MTTSGSPTNESFCPTVSVPCVWVSLYRVPEPSEKTLDILHYTDRESFLRLPKDGLTKSFPFSGRRLLDAETICFRVPSGEDPSRKRGGGGKSVRQRDFTFLTLRKRGSFRQKFYVIWVLTYGGSSRRLDTGAAPKTRRSGSLLRPENRGPPSRSNRRTRGGGGVGKKTGRPGLSLDTSRVETQERSCVGGTLSFVTGVRLGI